MLTAERFNLYLQEDYNCYYPIIEGWWKEVGWKPWKVEFLSSTGIMIFDSGVPVCAAWLFRSDSAVGFIAHIITNKSVKPRLKKECLKLLFVEMENEAKALGMMMVLFFITTSSLANMAEKLGYFRNRQEKCNELLKII